MDCGAITLRNQQQSPLLRLPPELRKQIFALAVGGQEVHVSSHSFGSHLALYQETQDEIGRKYPYYLQAEHFMALHQVCRQIHNETASLHFALNTWRGTAYTLLRLLNTCEPSGRLIETISINAFGGGSGVSKLLHMLSQLKQVKRVVVNASFGAKGRVYRDAARACHADFLANNCVFEVSP